MTLPTCILCAINHITFHISNKQAKLHTQVSVTEPKPVLRVVLCGSCRGEIPALIPRREAANRARW